MTLVLLTEILCRVIRRIPGMPVWHLTDHRLLKRLVTASIIDHNGDSDRTVLVNPLCRIGLKSDATVRAGRSKLVICADRHCLVIIWLA